MRYYFIFSSLTIFRTSYGRTHGLWHIACRNVHKSNENHRKRWRTEKRHIANATNGREKVRERCWWACKRSGQREADQFWFPFWVSLCVLFQRCFVRNIVDKMKSESQLSRDVKFITHVHGENRSRFKCSCLSRCSSSKPGFSKLSRKHTPYSQCDTSLFFPQFWACFWFNWIDVSFCIASQRSNNWIQNQTISNKRSNKKNRLKHKQFIAKCGEQYFYIEQRIRSFGENSNLSTYTFNACTNSWVFSLGLKVFSIRRWCRFVPRIAFFFFCDENNAKKNETQRIWLRSVAIVFTAHV